MSSASASARVSSYVDLFSVDELAILREVGIPYGSASEVRYARSLLQRVKVNHGILKNRYFVLPFDNPHFDEVQVGRGVVSSEFCGRWVSDVVCRNVEGHKGVMLGDVDCSGNIVVRHKHLWCHRSSCPICFYNGWAGRAARSIAGRIAEGVRLGFGKPEHVTVSVPVVDRDLPEFVLRKRCAVAAFDRGMSGFAMIFHAPRIDRVNKRLVRMPHYHLVGFIKGGFDRCRDCVHERGDCTFCDGFKGREARGFKRDGYLVKVHAVRKTIEGTAKYQLGHCTSRVGLKRSSAVTYWGLMACPKYKSSSVPVDDSCPVCKGEMTKAVRVGKCHVSRNLRDADYASVVVLPEFDEYGDANYVDVVEVGRNG